MIYKEAVKIADGLLEKLSPYCDRISIAGSVRRAKSDVHDIEIVAQPKIIEEKDMFGDIKQKCMIPDEVFQDWKVIKNGHRYKQFILPEGINLDLFIVGQPIYNGSKCEPKDGPQWGVILTIRTGPTDFSKWIVTPEYYGGCLPGDCKVKDGGVYKQGQLIRMDEEIDFLEFLKLGWIEPAERMVMK